MLVYPLAISRNQLIPVKCSQGLQRIMRIEISPEVFTGDGG